MRLTVKHREANRFRDEEYLIADTQTEGEWLRFHWRVDVPRDYRQRHELGARIEQ